MRTTQFRLLVMVLLASSAILTTRSAHSALTFAYSYSFNNGLVMSGTLEGNLVGDVVNNVANVSVFYNGVPMPGTVFTARYTISGWVNGPIVSFDITKNNFLFANSDIANNDNTLNSYFFIIDGDELVVAGAESTPLGNFANEEYTAPQWSLTVVPEPSTYFAGALLLLPIAAQVFRRIRPTKQN